jgi:hypothetical protein
MAEGGSVQDRLGGCSRDSRETPSRHSIYKRSERAQHLFQSHGLGLAINL